jgi:hypothetical protein
MVVFWIFVAVAAVAGVVGDYKKRQAKLEPLRIAIEKGQQLDPKVVEQLMASEREEDGPVDPRDLSIGGIITCASGFGVAVAAPFVAHELPRALYPMFGFGALAVCVGVGLLISAKVLEKSRDDRQRESKT